MKKIITIYSLAYVIAFASPALAAVTTFKQLINEVLIGSILRPIVPFLIGLAVVIFIYGVLTTMLSEGGEKKEDGKQYMMWGIVGIFVMVSVWGLVGILSSTFSLDNTTIPTIKITIPPGLND